MRRAKSLVFAALLKGGVAASTGASAALGVLLLFGSTALADVVSNHVRELKSRSSGPARPHTTYALRRAGGVFSSTSATRTSPVPLPQ